MAEEDEGGSSLAQLHGRAQQLTRQLETLRSSISSSFPPSTSPSPFSKYNDAVSEATRAVEACKAAVERVALFSPNEGLDDLTTSSLRYLSLDRELGDLLLLRQDFFPPSLSSNGGGGNGATGRDRRKATLRAAQSAYVDFLLQLDRYGILSGPDRKMLARLVGNDDDGSSSGGGRGSESRDHFSVVATTDPAARRTAKIARLKDEKALKGQLEELRQRQRATTNDDDDDETERRLRLAELQLGAMDVFQGLEMIGQELQVLADAPSAEEEQRRQAAARPADQRLRSTGGEEYSERLDTGLRSTMMRKGGPILDAKGKPLQPFTLLDKRQDLRKGVFRSGHNLPTMSIDEYLAEERRRGGIIEGGGEPPVVEPNEDDLEAADRETMKQREWDEFKEENPKGSGNTINRG